MPGGSPGRTHFTSRLYGAALKAGTPVQVGSAIFDSSAAMNRQVFEEDYTVCRRVPPGTWSSEPLDFPTPAEAKVAHFRRSYRAEQSIQSKNSGAGHARS